MASLLALLTLLGFTALAASVVYLIAATALLPTPAQSVRNDGLAAWVVNFRWSWAQRRGVRYKAHVIAASLYGLVIGYVSAQPRYAYSIASDTVVIEGRQWVFYVIGAILTLVLLPVVPIAIAVHILGVVTSKLIPTVDDATATAFARHMKEAIERTERTVANANGALASDERDTLVERIVNIDDQSRVA